MIKFVLKMNIINELRRTNKRSVVIASIYTSKNNISMHFMASEGMPRQRFPCQLCTDREKCAQFLVDLCKYHFDAFRGK